MEKDRKTYKEAVRRISNIVSENSGKAYIERFQKEIDEASNRVAICMLFTLLNILRDAKKGTTKPKTKGGSNDRLQRLSKL